MHREGQISAPFKRSQDGYFYYYVWHRNKRKYVSTGTKKKVEAINIIRERVANNDIFNTLVRKHYRTFQEFAKNFWDYDTCPYVQDRLARGLKYSKMLAKSNQARLETYVFPYLGKYLLADLTERDVSDWLVNCYKKKVAANGTLNAVLGNVRIVLGEAEKQGEIDKNVALLVKPLSKEESNPRGCFTRQQINLLFKEPWEDRYLEYACKIAATTGMRKGEIRALKMSDLDFENNLISVNNSYSEAEGLKCTKTGKARVVPMTPDVKAFLEKVPKKKKFIFSYKGAEPLSSDYFLDGLKKQMDKLGIDHKKYNLTFHSFRHYANTLLLSSGINPEIVRAIIGHTDDRMSNHYLHTDSMDFEEIRRCQLKLIG